MADPARQQFQVKRGQALGDRLIWRYPMASAEGRRALSGLDPRESVTVGYYRRLTEPHGPWTFVAVTTAHAAAALRMPTVQRRIGEDLSARIVSAIEDA